MATYFFYPARRVLGSVDSTDSNNMLGEYKAATDSSNTSVTAIHVWPPTWPMCAQCWAAFAPRAVQMLESIRCASEPPVITKLATPASSHDKFCALTSCNAIPAESIMSYETPVLTANSDKSAVNMQIIEAQGQRKALYELAHPQAVLMQSHNAGRFSLTQHSHDRAVRLALL